MSAAKHTPGPWTREGTRVLPPESCGIVECCGIAVCQHGSRREEAEANARLIAAAPELLKFAQLYVDAWIAGEVSDKELLKAASALIAKATGEPA